MAGVIRVENKVLTTNEFGFVFVGPTNRHMKKVAGVGEYVVHNGSLLFEEVDGQSFIQAILGIYATAWFKIIDFKKYKDVFEITGMPSGFNKGSYQIASLGGILRFLNNNVRMFSKEAAENI